MDLAPVASATIAFVGVLLGISLTEFFNRRKRVEFYSQKIFEKRLEVHENMLKFMQIAYDAANEAFADRSLGEEERHELIDVAVIAMAEYGDQSELYIDRYVGANVVGAFVSVKDVADIKDDAEREKEIGEFRLGYQAAKRMILEESGVSEINRHFRAVARSKPSSPMIARIKELEKDRDKKRWKRMS